LVPQLVLQLVRPPALPLAQLLLLVSQLVQHLQLGQLLQLLGQLVQLRQAILYLPSLHPLMLPYGLWFVFVAL
jgi:hypothetical protein